MTVDEFMRTDAGGHIFNGLQRARLVNGDTGIPVRFSQNYAFAKRIFGMLLEMHILPEDQTQRIGEEASR